MERRQLEFLVAVADAGSVTGAATRLRVAQPGVSAQLAALERELGERLFDRDRHGARPTAVGTTVVARAREALAALDAVRGAVDEARGLLRGAVVVGTVRGVPLGQLATALAGFRSDHPGVETRLVEAESSDLLRELGTGGIDLALVGLAGDAPPGVVAVTVLADRLVVAVAPRDRWARRRRIGLAELATRPLVALARGTGNRDALDRACAAAGVTPQVVFEAGTVASVVELARAGLGAAVVPSGVTGGPLGAGLHAVTLAPAVTSRLALAWADSARRAPSPAARVLRRTVVPPPPGARTASHA